jgi:hypothetical protein
VIVIWAASRTDWEILRAEPFMPGTRPTSTRSSEEHELFLSRVGQFMQPAFVGPRLVAFGKIRTRSFDQRHASAGEFPASTREGRTFKMTCAHRLTVERKRHGTHLPLP